MSKLTDTDETQAMQPTDSSEHMRAIARDEGKREARTAVLSHESSCAQARELRKEVASQASELWKAMDAVRSTVTDMNKELSERKGADKAQARNLTLIVGIASAIGVAANLIGLLWKVKHGG